MFKALRHLRLPSFIRLVPDGVLLEVTLVCTSVLVWISTDA